MGDDIARILASLERLENGQNQLRADLMARMDRHQERLDSMDEHLTMRLGYADRVDQRSSAVSADNRLLGELLMSLTRIVRRLEGRVNDTESKP